MRLKYTAFILGKPRRLIWQAFKKSKQWASETALKYIRTLKELMPSVSVCNPRQAKQITSSKIHQAPAQAHYYKAE